MQVILTWFHFAADRLPEVWLRTGEHLLLTGVSTVLAIAIGLPLGILASTSHWLRASLLTVIGISQTIPSLAMLAILLSLLGRIGVLPAIIALTIYALLPIVRNTVTGIDRVDANALEAAQGLGLTPWQQLRMVKIPLASAVILAGVRTAAVVGVGIATLSAFIGAGGLGQFINRGLALSNTSLILLGAIPAAILAVLVDAAIASMAWALQPVRQSERTHLKARLRPLALAVPLLLFLAGCYGAIGNPFATDRFASRLRIACKNFTEQVILGEIMAQMIETHTDLVVDRRFNLGGTMICHEALAAGEIDLYAEYTGTGLMTVLGAPAESDADKVLNLVRTEYKSRFGLVWLEPLGFNNTYALTVRRADAQANGWRSISDLVPAAARLRGGFTPEFSERADGYRGVRDAYHLKFAEVRDLDPSMMYQAVARGEVDVICAFTTDGRVAAYDLQTLVDDRSFFPAYLAVPVIRADIIQEHTEVRDVLLSLRGALDGQAMQRLNFQVDEKGRRCAAVVREFLLSQGLL